MQVELKHYTPLQIADDAIGKCWDKPSKGECNIKRMHRVANQFKHASTIEHLSYNFDIDGVSRALLQELARHRIASYSVKSSRYTLGELAKEKEFMTINNEPYLNNDGKFCSIEYVSAEKYIVLTGNEHVDYSSLLALEHLRLCLMLKIPNDIAKYCMPEAYKTSIAWTINARSLQNFLKLRTDKSALWEIRELAYEVYNQLPENHKFLFEEFLYDESKEMEIGFKERNKYFNETGMFSDDDTIRRYLEQSK